MPCIQNNLHFCPDKKAKAFGPVLTISVSVSHLLISINASSNFAIYCAKVSNPSKKILMENFLPSPLLVGGGRYSIFDGLLSLFYKLCFRWSVPVSNFKVQKVHKGEGGIPEATVVSLSPLTYNSNIITSRNFQDKKFRKCFLRMLSCGVCPGRKSDSRG